MNPETRDAIKFVGTVLIGFGAFILVSVYFPIWAVWTVYVLGLIALFPMFLEAEKLQAYGLLALLWLIAVFWGVT